MQIEKKKSKEDSLKEITLSDDSNLILPEVSFPSSYTTQGEIKYGAKSKEYKIASEHELLEYQKRVTRRDSIPTYEEIRNLIIESTERRRALQQSIAEQKEEFQQKHAAVLQARHTKEREEARQFRIAHENPTQREIRISEEEEIKTHRSKEIQALENRCRKEKEDITIFFEQSSNRFSQKYGNATKKVSGETGIDRIISSRPFSTGRYAHRCVVCGYHNPESLSISKIYQHIYENKDSHMQYTLSEIDKTNNNLITEIREKHAAEDNPDLRQQKLSKDLEALKKLKGEKYR
jgi:rubrerythrin